MEKVVELVCKAEGKLIANIKVTDKATIDERTIKLNSEIIDKTRMPLGTLIRNGVQMTCGHCFEPLFFRAETAGHPKDKTDTAKAGLLPAMPGSVKVEA